MPHISRTPSSASANENEITPRGCGRLLASRADRAGHGRIDRSYIVPVGWLGETKAVSSVIMGSTPEFEMALYTMCFLGGGEENLVWLDDFQLKVSAAAC